MEGIPLFLFEEPLFDFDFVFSDEGEEECAFLAEGGGLIDALDVLVVAGEQFFEQFLRRYWLFVLLFKIHI